jgi:GTPase SAR1 family protein
MQRMLVLYGLPGAGKTTLCRALADHGFCYADITQHPLWDEKTVPYWRMAFEMYQQNGNGNGFLTEGVLGDRARRDHFVDRIWKKLGAENRFEKPLIIHVKECISILDSRRPGRNRRSLKNGGQTASYSELEAAEQIGSDIFHHQEMIGSDFPTVDDRVRWVLDTLQMIGSQPTK